MLGSRTALYVFDAGTVTRIGMRDEILEAYDNARLDTTSLVENFLEAETMQRMECLACSLDLNSIECV
ncbi:hypothetical protein TNCV_5069511 [Trichonephila clavipes]|nr:hypothetical protein TNCV_5069511 [Trichonephila clavipes]